MKEDFLMIKDLKKSFGDLQVLKIHHLDQIGAGRDLIAFRNIQLVDPAVELRLHGLPAAEAHQGVTGLYILLPGDIYRTDRGWGGRGIGGVAAGLQGSAEGKGVGNGAGGRVVFIIGDGIFLPEGHNAEPGSPAKDYDQNERKNDPADEFPLLPALFLFRYRGRL